MMETGQPGGEPPFDRPQPADMHDATVPLERTARVRNLWVAIPLVIYATAALTGSFTMVRIDPADPARSIGVVIGRVFMLFVCFTAVCIVMRRHQGRHFAGVPDVDLSSDVLVLAMSWTVYGLCVAGALLWIEIEEMLIRHGISGTNWFRIGIAVVLTVVSLPSVHFLWKRHRAMSDRRKK